MEISIDRLDHLVLIVKDLEATLHFYSHGLGMEAVTFGLDRKALKFGSQKINLHEYGHEWDPKSLYPTPGSADLCFITRQPLADVINQLTEKGIPIIEGPIERTGAQGLLLSVYIRDPDGNLIELSHPLKSQD
jgi:catechol 2,3-dioxygenase-like lactoylglutathione lyase family enzyme